MKTRIVHQIPPSENNPRNSEGAFIRAKNGDILFAYSRYKGDSVHDHAACDTILDVEVAHIVGHTIIEVVQVLDEK